MKKVEDKIDRYLSEAEVFETPAPQEFSGTQKTYPSPAGSVPGTYDPTRDAGSITQGLKRLAYYMTMANTPAKFQRVLSLASELANRFPQNNKIAMIFDVIKKTPIKIMRSDGE